MNHVMSETPREPQVAEVTYMEICTLGSTSFESLSMAGHQIQPVVSAHEDDDDRGNEDYDHDDEEEEEVRMAPTPNI
jgi:hypothetical protein